jgi:hypothetical protein
VIVKPKKFNPVDKILADEEPMVSDVSFNIFKFNNRPKPIDPKDILIICCFSEFGCETVGVMYCIPRLLQKYSGKYVICVGWYGRDYLYRHLADEFWELKLTQDVMEKCVLNCKPGDTIDLRIFIKNLSLLANLVNQNVIKKKIQFSSSLGSDSDGIRRRWSPHQSWKHRRKRSRNIGGRDRWRLC